MSGKLKFSDQIHLGSNLISRSSRTFIVAEAGVNHGGDLGKAKELIDAAVSVGANAVKFQSFKTEELIRPGVGKARYQVETTGAGETQFEMLKRLEIVIAQMAELKSYADARGILFLTTPFDDVSLDELDQLDLPAYKVASTDTTNLPFLRKVAQKGKPILLSTGMSYLAEVEMALREIHSLNKDLVLLQCAANYPLRDEEANLAVLLTYQEQFDVLVGYSDHTVGVGAGPYAVPLGARVLEKHFTLDKSAEGPDHRASLDIAELQTFIARVRQVETFLGDSAKYPSLAEIGTRRSLQKSLVASMPIQQGDVFGPENCKAMRTGGDGISPLYYRELFGRPSWRNFAAGEVIEP